MEKQWYSHVQYINACIIIITTCYLVFEKLMRHEADRLSARHEILDDPTDTQDHIICSDQLLLK